MNASEIFALAEQEFDPARAGNLNAKYQFNLSGEEGGDWLVTVQDGACKVTQETIENPDVTFKMDAGDFSKLIAGETNPIAAFMQGKIKIDGNMELALKIQELFEGVN